MQTLAEFEDTILATKNSNPLVQSYSELNQNWPNPFHKSTNISFTMQRTSFASLTIYNMNGEKVKTLMAGTQNEGKYTLSWDGKNDWGRPVESGIYYYQLENGQTVKTKRMILL